LLAINRDVSFCVDRQLGLSIERRQTAGPAAQDSCWFGSTQTNCLAPQANTVGLVRPSGYCGFFSVRSLPGSNRTEPNRTKKTKPTGGSTSNRTQLSCAAGPLPPSRAVLRRRPTITNFPAGFYLRVHKHMR